MNQKGFSLIEMMIAIAIIGILSSYAFPAFTNYLAKSQASEAQQLLAGLKSPISEYWRMNGEIPHLQNDLGAVTQGKYVATIATIQNSSNPVKIVATYNQNNISSKLAGKTVVMTFNTGVGQFGFRCSSLDSAVRFQGCQ